MVLFAIFVSASNANAFTSLSLVFGNQVWVNHLIPFQQPMSDPTNEPSREPIREPTNDRMNDQPTHGMNEQTEVPLQQSGTHGNVSQQLVLQQILRELKWHQRLLINYQLLHIQRTTCGSANRLLTMCRSTRGNTEWKSTK